MPQVQIRLRCHKAECAAAKPTTLNIEVDDRVPAGAPRKTLLVYCNNNHPNKITVPGNWTVDPPLLGRDVVGYEGGVPVFEGRDPYAAED